MVATKSLRNQYFDGTANELLASVTENMQRSFDPKTTEELAEEAILQLQDKQLVKTWGASSQSSRRKFLTTLGAAAVPLVVSLTIADQKAYAGATGSKPTTHPPTVPLPTPHS